MTWLLDDDESDARTAHHLDKGVEAMADRRTLLIFLAIMGGLNLLIWAAVLLVPEDVRSAFETVHGISNKISVVVLGLVFGVGLWFTYSLLRVKFPDIEDLNLDSTVFGSYVYHASSKKRWLVWLFSSLGGVVNLLAVVVATLLLTS